MTEIKFSMDEIIKEIANLPTDEMSEIFEQFTGLNLIQVFNDEELYKEYQAELQKLIDKYGKLLRATESIFKGLNEKDAA